MKILLKNVRLAFPALFEAKAYDFNSETKYSAKLLIDKCDPQLKTLESAIEAVAKERWKEKYKRALEKINASDKSCVSDGDMKGDSPGFEGHVFVRASNRQRPLVLDGSKNILTGTEGLIYSGCYVIASLDIWAQVKFQDRINATLLGVQFYRDGDHFSAGAIPSLDDFEAIPF